MHKVYETAPATFFELFQKVSYPYPTGFSKLCYKIPQTNLTKFKYKILSRELLIQNNFLSHYEKQIESSLLKYKVKLKLLAFKNKITFSKIFCPIKQILLCVNVGLDDKAKMAFWKSFLNHMKWHYIDPLSSSIHLSSSIFTWHYVYLLYTGDIIRRDLFYLLDFNYREHLL